MYIAIIGLSSRALNLDVFCFVQRTHFVVSIFTTKEHCPAW